MATQTKPANKNATGTTDVNVATLIPYAGNSKLHPDWHIEQIAASIHRFGFVAPIVVDEDNMILAGHGRAMAAKKLGIEMVPVVVKTGLSKAEKQAYIIADNRLTTVTDFDEETLAAELKCIMESGEFDDLELIGFTDEELEELLGTDDDEGDKKDVTPPLEADVFTQTGDIYRIGPHFLVCGDSTAPEIAAKIVAEVGKADMCFTDPPYNVAYEGKTKSKMIIKNDHMKGKDFLTFLTAAFKNMNECLKGGAAYYVAHAGLETSNFQQGLELSGFMVKQLLIWVKNTLVMGRGDYQWQHEPILYGWKSGESHKWYGDRKQTTVWKFDRPTRNEFHPTMKPVELVAYAIGNSSKKDDVVLDLFGGSGSTMVACQHTGRVNASVELDPAYCDVIVRRMADLYPVLPILRNGEPFVPPAGKPSEATD